MSPRPGKLWIWLLIVLVGVILAAFVGLIIYKKQWKLTSEKLDAARARWEQAGIRHYDLEVHVSGRTEARYRLQVRDGRTVQVSCNDQEYSKQKADEFWTVPGLFDVLQTNLKNEADPNSPRIYTRVEFDPNDGHLVRYVHKSLSGPRQDYTIETTFKPVARL